MHQVIITISTDGKMAVAVNGVKGESCHDLTAKLREVGKVEGDDHTPEFYEAAETAETVSTGI